MMMMMMMMMIAEHSTECELAEETEVLDEDLPQCRLVHYKCHVT
jgi:hypothetical protein